MKAQKNAVKNAAAKNGKAEIVVKTASKDANPYQVGGLRAAIFAAGIKGYASRAELSEVVAKKVGKTTAEKVGYQVAVVCNPKHPGQNNGVQGGKGKSKEVWDKKVELFYLVARQ